MEQVEQVEQVERQRYHFQTIQPETIIDDLRDQGVQLVGLSIGLGDAYGLYVVECIACGDGALLDAMEAGWGFDAIAG